MEKNKLDKYWGFTFFLYCLGVLLYLIILSFVEYKTAWPMRAIFILYIFAYMVHFDQISAYFRNKHSPNSIEEEDEID